MTGRRSFLKKLLAGAVALVAAPFVKAGPSRRDLHRVMITPTCNPQAMIEVMNTVNAQPMWGRRAASRSTTCDPRGSATADGGRRFA